MTSSALRRYSKKRGPGDQTSGGRGKLLQSDLSHTELLVRETIQNSWDAKLEGCTPAYGIRVRRADHDLRNVLRSTVFSQRDGLTGLDSSLLSSDLYVTEVYDRGTRGLDGPVNSGQAPRPGEPNNFNALVFDIGTTKASSRSGGTYGFGKTAAFESSGCHTVIYWTHTADQLGGYEHRLIACCLGDPYDESGQRYTGAHWWGVSDGTAMIEPLRGEEARELGERLFETHFGVEEDGSPETGTSILIIDPVARLSDPRDDSGALRTLTSSADAAEYAELLERAISRNLWPKLLPHRAGEDPPILVNVYCDAWEEANRTPEPPEGDLERYGFSLQRIRSAQGEADEASRPRTCLQEVLYPINLSLATAHRKGFSTEQIMGGREDSTVGHLHLWIGPNLTGDDSGLESNSICIMRSEVELVVNYIESDQAEEAGQVRWFGVFKPTPECDHHFAACEPPSHDSWSPLSTAPPESAYVVNRVKRNIAGKRREFLTQRHTKDIEGTQSVRRVSSMLRSFAPLETSADDHSAPASRSAARSRPSSGKQRSHTEATPHAQAVPLPGGKTLHVVRVQLGQRPSRPIHITPVIQAVTVDGVMDLDESEVQYEFEGGDPVFQPGEQKLLRIVSEAETRLQLRLEERPA